MFDVCDEAKVAFNDMEDVMIRLPTALAKMVESHNPSLLTQGHRLSINCDDMRKLFTQSLKLVVAEAKQYMRGTGVQSVYFTGAITSNPYYVKYMKREFVGRARVLVDPSGAGNLAAGV